MLKYQVFTCSLYGISVRDALAKTKSKSDLKTRFYERKRINGFYFTGEMTWPCV